MRRIDVRENSTAYSTRDIVKLCTRVHREYMTRFTQPTTVRLKIRYRRNSRSSWGYAYYDSNLVILQMPKDGRIDPNQLAHTFQHELDHCRGVRHSDMGECNRHRREWGEPWHKQREFPDCSDIVIGFKRPAKKTKPSHAEKVVRLESRKKTWMSKRKRAENAIRRIERQLRYLMKKRQEKANEQKEQEGNRIITSEAA